MPLSLRQLSPLRVIIGNEDVTAFVDDGWTFSNSDPGGFEACSLPFPKDLPQMLRGLPIRIESGLSVAWEGRVAQIQRSLGHRTTIMGEGYSGLLKENWGSMVFIDRDLSRWTGASLTRQKDLVSASFQPGTPQAAPDPTSNTPSLILPISDTWVSPFKPIVEAWYDAGPNNLIGLVYRVGRPRPTVDGNWFESLNASSDANATTLAGTGNIASDSVVSGYFFPSAQYRFFLIQHFYNATNAGAAGAQYNEYYDNLAVYGNHGLSGHGPDPAGFYPSDIVNWVLNLFARNIPNTLVEGTIQATDASNYILPHSVYYMPVTLDTFVSDMGVVQGWHWGVWSSFGGLTGSGTPRLDFQPRPLAGAFTASCRRQDCENLDIREDLSGQYNSCIMTFSDVAGNQSYAAVSADNAILDEAGITNRTLLLNGGTMTPATASLQAALSLAITNIEKRVAGSASIIAPIDQGGPTPAWLLQAGIDRLRVTDAASTSAWGSMSDYPISRVEATIGSSGFTTNVEFGSGANLIETMQARLNAASAAAGQGGG